jgi:hypothetical protein
MLEIFHFLKSSFFLPFDHRDPENDSFGHGGGWIVDRWKYSRDSI